MDKSDIDKLQKFADGEISLSEKELRELAKTFVEQKRNIETLTEDNRSLEKQNKQAKIDIASLYSEIIQTQKELIYLMGEIGETRSRETGNHVKRVALYSYVLAKEYGLSEAEAQLLKNASPMHDIGKIGIPDAILNKPGRLTLEEFEIMKTHAEIGYKLLNHSDRPLLKASAIVAYQHHERWDGKGYPRGLKGEEIHIFGRITAIADVFDALSSDRVYKKAWELDRILQLFKEERGRHFEPKLVDIFFSNLDELLKIREKFQDVEDSPYKPG